MSQTTYNNRPASYFAGMISDSRVSEILTKRPTVQMNFGRAAGAEAGNILDVHYPIKDVATVTYDADFVTSNSIAFSVTVGGVTESITAVDFDTDHDTTAGLLATAIAGLSNVSSVVITDSATDNRIFRVETIGYEPTVATEVTGGASQAGATIAYTSDDIFRGITAHEHNENGYYAANDALNLLTKGEIVVDTSVAVTADEDAYVDIAGGVGKFTNISTNNLATGGKFTLTNSAAGLSKIVINLP